MFMFRRSPCRPKLADEAEEHNEMKVSERSPNQAQFLSEDVLGRARTCSDVEVILVLWYSKYRRDP
jgi:hypothetical protein